jgi:hypothetical protein
MKNRKPLFKPADPLEPMIQAMRIRIGTKHTPLLDFVRARETVKQINITRGKDGIYDQKG